MTPLARALSFSTSVVSHSVPARIAITTPTLPTSALNRSASGSSSLPMSASSSIISPPICYSSDSDVRGVDDSHEDIGKTTSSQDCFDI